MRALAALAFVLVLAPALAGAIAPAVAHVEDYVITVDGEPAHGLIGVPVGEPRGLVVIAHGYGHVAESHRTHLQHLADQGYLAVAMDFRGSGFPLRAGADDTLAAARALSPGIDTVVLYSVSMGTAVSSMVLAESGGLFDHWVDNEGLAMLAETWTEAKAVAPAIEFGAVASAQIETECGGTPATAPACYLERSAVLRAPEFVGLQSAVLTHGLNDGLVPYDQGREMLAALRATGVPADFYTVVRTAEGEGEGTTLTGHAGQGGQGLAGHGTESKDEDALTGLSFRLLDELLAGDLVPANAERVVDDGEELVS